MPVLNRIAGFADEMTEWRHWLHRNPELGLECHKTAGFVAEKLREFGVDEIHEGIAKTGIVALINGSGDGPTIGLRADMDALPIVEETGLDHASETPGKMHACGHDGHTTMLLGAAKYLAETRQFKGRVALVFQPDEEGDGGGRVMVEEGLIERFDISQIYALHNAPEIAEGHFATCPGPIMAAADQFFVTVTGQGGHAASPETAVDPIPPAMAMISGFQSILSRNVAASERLVISVTTIDAGMVTNIIPQRCSFSGTVRSFDPAVREKVIRRMEEIVAGSAAAHGVEAEIDYQKGYPPTVNHADETAFAVDVAREVVGERGVVDDLAPQMFGEDFSYMLEACPGAYVTLGQGDTEMCHHPAFDFNDTIAPVGASFFARLVERALPV